MDATFLDITADSVGSDCEERPVKRYGSSIARRSNGDVGKTSQVHPSRVVS